MSAPIDEKILERYLKVKTLWERADGNEKANAARVMAALQQNYPGIDQFAQSSNAGPRVEQMATPSWTQAMADAVGVLAGFTNPFDVINKYAPYIDEAGAPRAPRIDTPEEAAQLIAKHARVGVRDSVRGLRVTLDLDPETASIIDEYLGGHPPDEALAKLAHRAGDLVGRRFYALLREWRADQ